MAGRCGVRGWGQWSLGEGILKLLEFALFSG